MPNQRSYHTKITPLGGGLAIVSCWYACIAVLHFIEPEMMPKDLAFALIPGILLVFLGIKDDAIQLSPWLRLFIQAMTVGVSMYLLGGLPKIDFGLFVIDNPIITNGLAFVTFLWFINLFNFYDGIDGNLGTESISICLLSLIFISPNALIFLIPCVGGFLKLNWQKAKIFMGDAGSTFLGFNFAVFGIYFQNQHNVSIVLWVIICMVAIFDTSYTVVRRIFYKENILTPHKNQMFHRLVSSGFSHQQVVLIQQSLNIFVALGTWYAYQNPSMILYVLIGILIIFGLYSFWVEKRFPWKHNNQPISFLSNLGSSPEEAGSRHGI
ncbi:MAG: hypothetical protein MJZ33_14385 [Paludibacteraceae bacterium]|nr:hypothetical protein [Paludibacteraceae bacterium]